MTAERTEDEALRLILQVSVGGRPVQLRTLTIKESDAWLDELGTSMSSMDVPGGDDGTSMLRSLLKMSGDAMLRLVVAYDKDGALGDDLTDHMTKRELAAAIEAMVTAEDPSGEATGRSVAEAFGLPSRMLAAGMAAVTETADRSLRLVPSPSSPSASGDSTSAGTSIPAGQGNNSSSIGRTRRTGSPARRQTAAS